MYLHSFIFKKISKKSPADVHLVKIYKFDSHP